MSSIVQRGPAFVRDLGVLAAVGLLFMSFGCAAPAARGTIYYDGKRIDRVDQRVPFIGLDDMKDNVRYEDGEFVIRRLASGKHTMMVAITADTKSRAVFAGDYYLWYEFGTIKDVTSALQLHLLRIIHITQPIDNSGRVPEVDAGCMDRPAYASPFRISWDTLGPDVYFDYEIELMKCSFTRSRIMAHGTTRETSLALPLPKSAENEYYLLKLQARKGGRFIGTLMLESPKSTTAWDFRFRIKE